MADRSIVDLFGKNLSLINLGLPSFGKDLADQGVSVVDASWQPPAAGDTKTIEALTRFMAWPEAAHRKVNEANALAVKTLREAQPVILDVRTARDVVPGMHDKLVLHAGPPVTW